MRLVLSSTLLGLAWFAAINVFASLVSWAMTVWLERQRTTPSAASWLALRLLPAAASTLFVGGIFLPAHWRFEQSDTEESFGVILSALAALGLVMIGRSIARAFAVGLAGRRLSQLMQRGTRPIGNGAFEVGGLPGVSLAGILQPRILVGAAARAALTAEELDVAIEHEVAHRRSQDNLKRFLMFCAPDVLGWSSIGRRLEDRWQAEAECQADAHAVMGDDSRAVVLASALVKVAQLTGRHRVSMIAPAWSAFHVPSLLEVRIRRLVAGRVAVPLPAGQRWLAGATVALAMPAGVWLLGLSYRLHLVTEAMVTHLP